MEFADFLRQYQDMVYTTALRITADPRDAQDIAQEVFIQAHAWFDTLQVHENAGGWLRKTARNLSINHVVRYRRRFVFFATSGNKGSMENLETETADDEWLFDKVDLLKKVLLKLPDTFRLPLVLYYYEGLDYSEVAQQLGISLSKVKTDIMRGKQQLKKAIDRLEYSYA